MEPVKIKNFVDNSILHHLDKNDFETTRNYLYDRISTKKVEVTNHLAELNITGLEFTLDNVESQLTKNRYKYLAYYIIFAQNRIIDLFHIEHQFQTIDLSPRKKFKALLFKEKLN